MDWRSELHRWRWPAAVTLALLIIASAMVWAVSTSQAADRGAVLIAALTLGVTITLWVVEHRAKRTTAPTAPHDDGDEPPRAPRLTIGEDGHLLDGDDVLVDVVLDLLETPAAQRSVLVDATPLQDPSFKRRSPDHYAQLRRSISQYQRLLTGLLRGEVHYYWKWEVKDLVEAARELQAISLRGQFERDAWYVWPADRPTASVLVRFDSADARSVRSGFYGEGVPGSTDTLEGRGMPADRPIWLQQIFPRIVWSRVVPAVLAHRDAEGHGDARLDISTWVLSDRPPSGLAKDTPAPLGPGLDPGEWSW